MRVEASNCLTNGGTRYDNDNNNDNINNKIVLLEATNKHYLYKNFYFIRYNLEIEGEKD